MNKDTFPFDWNQVRAFLVTAEEGSFSAAAKVLGLTQPTMGRQIAALEETLNVVLFERMGRGLSLTQSGVELLEHVRAMGDAANRVSLVASGHSQIIEGTVCITTTDIFSLYMLPKAIKKIREEHPGIIIKVVAANNIKDLLKREADIAIRHARPDQPDLIAKLLRNAKGTLYATTDYLEKIGSPSSVAELENADFIGFDQPDDLLQFLKENGIKTKAENIKIYSANAIFAWEMVKQGMGLGVMSKEVADLTPGITKATPDFPIIDFPIWLVAHRELHTSRRIRIVFDILAETLKHEIEHPLEIS